MTSPFDYPNLEMYELPFGAVTDLVIPVKRGVSLLQFISLDQDPSLLKEAPPQDASENEGEREGDKRTLEAVVMIDAASEKIAAAAKREIEAELELESAEERVRMEKICAEFKCDRQRYFAAAETQVVRLALAIARRVLGREIAVDAMHLTTIVKAALAKLHEGSQSVLRVNVTEVDGWRALFPSDGAIQLQVVGEARIPRGECVLDTGLGRVHLGVEAQMQEIERGFSEVMQRQGA